MESVLRKLNYGLKQHALIIHDEKDESKNIFKMEFKVLNEKLFKSLPHERIAEVEAHIDNFIASLKRFKKELKK